MKLKFFSGKRLSAKMLTASRIVNLIFLLTILVGTFVLAMIQGGYVTWFLFYGLLPFELYGLLLFFYPLSDFSIKREIVNVDHYAGGTMKVTLHLQRKWPFPLFSLTIYEETPRSIVDKEKKVRQSIKLVLFPFWKRTLTISYLIHDLARGEHYFQPIQLQANDLLGFMSTRKDLSSTESVIVYPKVKPLSIKPMTANNSDRSHSQRYKNRKGTTLVSGVREYQPGDKERIIDWKSSAKRNELMSKNFEDEQTNHSALILNCFADPLKFEEMVSFSASAIATTLKKGLNIGLVLNKTNADLHWYNSFQEHSWLLHLAKIQAETTDEIFQEQSFFNQLSAAIYVTDTITMEKIRYFASIKSSWQTLQIIAFDDSAASQHIQSFAKSNDIDMHFITNEQDWLKLG